MTGNWVFLILPFLYLGITGALVVGAVFGIRALVRQFKKLKANCEARLFIYYYFMIACILIMAVSWVMNMGWFRLILTWIPLPLVHTAALVVLTHKSIARIGSCPKFKLYLIFSFITYLTAYLLFPDFGDIGPGYVFFGLIKNDAVMAVTTTVSVMSFVANLVILVLTLIAVIKTKKKSFDDNEFLKQIDLKRQKRIDEIRYAADVITVTGTVYYVSAAGDDSNDGKTELTPWKTLSKVSETTLGEGDAVLFRRGDVFRGFVKAQSGVTYAAYGEGEKPRLYGWDKSLADVNLWTLFDAEHHIWKLTEPILDCGTLVFDSGEAHCRKLIPSYKNSAFVCREDESRPFVMAQEMTRDLDMVCFYDERTTDKPSKGENFPVPLLDSKSLGELYLRCDGGNPAEVFREIEALPRRSMIQVGSSKNVTVDNLCLKYIGIHAISGGGYVEGLHVSNCEIGWVGGTVQHYFGTDPNYTQGRRGSVTRFGNGVEIYGGCDDYTVKNCYIYQVYDAGITHQVTTRGKKYTMTNIRYLDNVVENCVYSIEYFLEKTEGDTESYIDGCEIGGNILYRSGYGWGQQRHNVDTPAHIKGWSYENTAKNFVIHHNVFDRAAYRMLHTVAKTPESCPLMYGNTYIQKSGQTLGQYGANEICEPLNMIFDSLAEQKIAQVIGDKNASVHHIK